LRNDDLYYIAIGEPVHSAAVHAKMIAVSSPAAPLQSARLSFSRGDFDSARKLCRGILETCPEEAGALHLLGLIAHRDGDSDGAKDLLRRATESPHASALYLLTYADLFCKATDRHAAVDFARRATELDPALPLGWCYLGHLLLEMRRLDESRRCLQKALDLAFGLESGMVHLNDCTVSDEPHVPFGGAVTALNAAEAACTVSQTGQ